MTMPFLYHFIKSFLLIPLSAASFRHHQSCDRSNDPYPCTIPIRLFHKTSSVLSILAYNALPGLFGIISQQCLKHIGNMPFSVWRLTVNLIFIISLSLVRLISFGLSCTTESTTELHSFLTSVAFSINISTISFVPLIISKGLSVNTDFHPLI